MKRLLLGSALLAALLGLLPAPAGAAAPTVEVDGGTLSVSARDSPLAEVLLAIGARVRARVLVESVLADQVGAQRVTSAFVRVPIEEGLRRVLRGRNFILGYGPAGVDEIRVYVDGKTGFQELTATRTPGVMPSKVSPSDAAKRAAARERSLAPPADDPARLARARRVVLTDPDPAARIEALEELAETKDETLLLGTLTDALAREKDPQVLDALLDLADDHGPRLAGALRAFAAGDRGGAAARARAVEFLGEYDSADPATRMLLQTLARADASSAVRTAAQAMLDELQAPPAPRVREPAPSKPGPGAPTPPR
jgi:hypothetical protein